jgi:SAM-dependent methyltransferase
MVLAFAGEVPGGSPGTSTGAGVAAPPHDAVVIWHELECGAYAADLALWEELATEASGAVLELGCGTGRVALRLGRRGCEAVGLDNSSRLVGELERRVGGLPVTAFVGDAREFELERDVGLVLAPMQLVQLFAGADERRECLSCVAAHLAVGGLAGFAIVEEMPEAVDGAVPLPDAREVDGWVYSSLPVDVAVEEGAIRVRRLRQVVSPAGELSEETDEVVLRQLDAGALEAEAAAVGLAPAGRRSVPPTTDHVGSTVVLLRRDR